MVFDEQPHIILSEPFTAEGEISGVKQACEKVCEKITKLRKMQMQERMRKIMGNCEKLNRLLQVNKRTGEIKACGKPYYRGYKLSDVYGRYSCEKARAYEYCKELLYEIADYVFSYGITSNNVFKFTFAGVFQTGQIKFVLICTADYDRVYILEEN